MAERVGFEPTAPFGVTGFQDQLLKPLGHLSIYIKPTIVKMAGVAGLEPTNDGVKVRCLTDLAIPHSQILAVFSKPILRGRLII